MDISRIPNQDRISLDEDGWIHLGPLVTHNHCVASKLIREMAFPLARACWEVGSPQIRNRGTIAGNLITASPANDTITALVAMGAVLTLRSIGTDRKIELADFYLGVRKVDLRPDEMLVDIAFPAIRGKKVGTYIKFALRKAQAISLVNVAVILDFADSKVSRASIALGAVAPTIIHADRAEEYLTGKVLDDDSIRQAADFAMEAARPISDVRASDVYRKRIVRVVTKRALESILNRTEKEGFPENPVLLWGGEDYRTSNLTETVVHDCDNPIVTTINGQEVVFRSGQEKTLLRLLREEGEYIGTKEGCAEGECGACTIFLDGVAVMSCMVPAVRAHGAEIVTVEGLANREQLHPVQQAFVHDGAVQCGYCTPGFLMSAAKLLEERPSPSQEEIKQAITGNLCRCTGYYKIVEAIEHAAEVVQGR